MRRVVVTGIGLLTTLGNNKKETWNNLINGQSGIKKIDHFVLPQYLIGHLLKS